MRTELCEVLSILLSFAKLYLYSLIFFLIYSFFSSSIAGARTSSEGNSSLRGYLGREELPCEEYEKIGHESNEYQSTSHEVPRSKKEVLYPIAEISVQKQEVLFTIAGRTLQH